MMRYLIGVGTYAMGDDGIGLKIIERIVDRGMEKDFQALELGDDGMRLMTYFEEGTEKILLIDAILADRTPGEFFFFDPADVETKKILSKMTTHEGDVLKIIQMGELMGCPMPKIRVMGIQPNKMEPSMSLTPELEKRLNEYVEAAITELNRDW